MFNDPPELHHDLLAFAAICGEAAERHGDDLSAVETYIKARLSALPKEQRDRLASEIARVLRYCPPDGGAQIQ